MFCIDPSEGNQYCTLIEIISSSVTSYRNRACNRIGIQNFLCVFEITCQGLCETYVGFRMAKMIFDI